MGKLYVRVDDRLIHGQTIVAWCPTLGVKEIIAVDDESANNPLLKSIMMMGVPKGYKAHIVTTEEAKELLAEEGKDNRLLIVKVPSKLVNFQNELLKSEGVVLGNIAKREDTVHKVGGATGIFYLSDDDVKILDDLNAKSVDIVFQQLPTTSEIKWKTFRETI